MLVRAPQSSLHVRRGLLLLLLLLLLLCSA
jgi:hypothetical protein